MIRSSRILGDDFFISSTLAVAEEMLGKYLVRIIGKEEFEGMITEVEAYDGPQDKANHASIGKTKRNEVMYARGGYIYVYLTYGIHNMLNIVTGEKEYPAAILIRGTDRVSGPGRLTKFYNIDRRLNRVKAETKNGLWIEDRGVKNKKKDIKRGPRVGVQYGGQVWANKPYRFILDIDNKGRKA